MTLPSAGTPRGGARKGAGRKAVDGAHRPTQRLVMLDDETIAMARAFGAGALSAGIRKAVRQAAETQGQAWIEAARADMAARDAKPEAPHAPQPSKRQQRHVLDLMLGDHDRKVARQGG